jgi:hypothetical protein
MECTIAHAESSPRRGGGAMGTAGGLSGTERYRGWGREGIQRGADAGIEGEDAKQQQRYGHGDRAAA